MTAHTQLLAFEEAEWLYMCVQAEQAKHFRELRLSHRPPASADSAKLPFVLTADCRWQRWARATSEATLRTRMGLVNVLAETGRGEMAEDICRGVEEVCFAGTSGLFFLHPFSRAWISVGADEAARGGAPRHAAVAAEPRLSAGGQG